MQAGSFLVLRLLGVPVGPNTTHQSPDSNYSDADSNNSDDDNTLTLLLIALIVLLLLVP